MPRGSAASTRPGKQPAVTATGHSWRSSRRVRAMPKVGSEYRWPHADQQGLQATVIGAESVRLELHEMPALRERPGVGVPRDLIHRDLHLPKVRSPVVGMRPERNGRLVIRRSLHLLYGVPHRPSYPPLSTDAGASGAMDAVTVAACLAPPTGAHCLPGHRMPLPNGTYRRPRGGPTSTAAMAAGGRDARFSSYCTPLPHPAIPPGATESSPNPTPQLFLSGPRPTYHGARAFPCALGPMLPYCPRCGASRVMSRSRRGSLAPARVCPRPGAGLSVPGHGLCCVEHPTA